MYEYWTVYTYCNIVVIWTIVYTQFKNHIFFL